MALNPNILLPPILLPFVSPFAGEVRQENS